MSQNPVLLIQWEEKAGNDELKRIRELIMAAVKNDEGLKSSVPDCTEVSIKKPSESEFKNRLIEALKTHPNLQVIYISGHNHTAGLTPSRKPKVAVAYSEIGKIIKEHLQAGLGTVEVVYGSCTPMDAVAGKGKDRFLSPPVDSVWGFTTEPKGEEVASLMVAVIRHNMRCIKSASEANKKYAEACNEKGLENVGFKEFFGPVAEYCIQSAKQVISDLGFKPGRVVMSIRNPATKLWEDGESK